MWVEFLAMGLAVAGLIYVNWPKKEKKEQIPLETVIQEAEQALQFNPLEDMKKKPEAVKPLLQVLLQIREQRAAEELAEEESQRATAEKLRRANELLYTEREKWRAMKRRQEEQIRHESEKCILNGRIGPGHPHYPFTEAGRREAEMQVQRQAQQSEQAVQMGLLFNPHYQAKIPDLTKKPIGYSALEALSQQEQQGAMGAHSLSAYVDAPRYDVPAEEVQKSSLSPGIIAALGAGAVQAFNLHRRR